ncbi:hypothetical protein Dimus_019204 [Dionaea muscipula]
MKEFQKPQGLGGSQSLPDKSILKIETSDSCTTLDSSCSTGSYPFYGACPSTASISPNGTPISQPEPPQPSSYNDDKGCCSQLENEPGVAGDVDYLRYKLRELEMVMLGPNSDIIYETNCKVEPGVVSTTEEMEKWKLLMELVSRRNLKELLIACARAVSDNDLLTAEWLMSELRLLVAVSDGGEAIKRLGAYMLEGLVARLAAASGSSVYKTLRCSIEPPSSSDHMVMSYNMHLLYEFCPCFKFGYLSANGAIAEAVKDENRIHIIDFQIAQGGQWVSLIQALAARPSGPPLIRITGIEDPTSTYAQGGGGGGLGIVGRRLSRLAESCNVPFEFSTATIDGDKAELKDLVLRPGEALAINFPFMLHHIPADDVVVGTGARNQRDGLLRLVKSLSPKVVTLVEQELNTNSAAFLPRFLEVLDYYTAVFESIDATLPRECKERIDVEQHCLGREIVNIIACEGPARVERHEVLAKWRSRFLRAGFLPYPLSPFVNATIKDLLGKYCQHYKLEERDGALYLGWMNRVLVSSCAWH